MTEYQFKLERKGYTRDATFKSYQDAMLFAYFLMREYGDDDMTQLTIKAVEVSK